MRLLVAGFVLAILLSGCSGNHPLFAPRCPPPRDANDTCALEGDTGKVFWVAYINGPTFCRCPDKPVSPQ